MKEALPIFELGRVVASAAVAQFIDEAGLDIAPLLRRHHAGDWGKVGKEDWESNEAALKNGGRLLSTYDLSGHRVWVITEADRSATTVLFPDDY
jgi:hypothetical protein